MAVNHDEIKHRIEAKYAQKTQKVSIDDHHVGQMTIAFCDPHSIERELRGE